MQAAKQTVVLHARLRYLRVISLLKCLLAIGPFQVSRHASLSHLHVHLHPCTYVQVRRFLQMQCEPTHFCARTHMCIDILWSHGSAWREIIVFGIGLAKAGWEVVLRRLFPRHVYRWSCLSAWASCSRSLTPGAKISFTYCSLHLAVCVHLDNRFLSVVCIFCCGHEINWI